MGLLPRSRTSVSLVSPDGPVAGFRRSRRLHLSRLHLIGADAGEPQFDITAGWYRILLAATFGLGLASQLGLYLHGLYAISSDESERTLLAYKLTLAKAVEPFVWPPLPTIVTGLGLRVHNNLVTTPRVLVGVTGLLTLGAIVFLTRRLFDNRLAAVVAGVLAVFIPQRLILSVVPMADIFAYLFVVVAASVLIDWLRQGRTSSLVYASLCLLLAATVRYEAWFLNGVLVIYLGYRALGRRDLKMSHFVLVSGLLMAFPCLWILGTYLDDDSLAALSLTRGQFIAGHGHDYKLALRDDTGFDFARDNAIMPVFLLGVISLVYFAYSNRAIRAWAILMFSPLALLSVSMLIAFDVPMAAPFRTDGAWILLLVPFSAWAVVRLAQRASGATLGRLCAVSLLVTVCLVPIALRVRTLVDGALAYPTPLANKAFGDDLHSLLRTDTRLVLLNATNNLDYLNVLVLSNAPDRFVLNVDADPTRVAVYATERAYYLKHDNAGIARTYLTDKFGLASRLDVTAIRARNIGYLLVQNGAFIKALDVNAAVVPRGRFGSWALFALRQQATFKRG